MQYLSGTDSMVQKRDYDDPNVRRVTKYYMLPLYGTLRTILLAKMRSTHSMVQKSLL